MPSKTIKVFVVDDSSLFRKMIIDYLSSCPDIQVVGYAFNAYDARKKIPVLKPDVITMDVEMPGLNGIDFLKDFLPLHPIPVVLVSSLNLNVFDVLSAGAVDFVRKPDMNIVSKEQFFSALNSKIHIASFAKVRCSSVNEPHLLPLPPLPRQKSLCSPANSFHSGLLSLRLAHLPEVRKRLLQF